MEQRLFQLVDETSFTLSVLKQQENLDNIWIKEQIVTLKGLIEQVNSLEKDSSSIQTSTKNSKKTLNEINDNAKKLFKEINFRIKLDKDESLKEYFPKTLTDIVRDKKGFLRAFENIELKLNNETVESLLAFKERVIDMIKLLKDIDNSLINLDSNKELKKIDTETLYDKLNLEYKRLKLIVKAYYLGTKVKESMFFMKKSTKKHKKESTVVTE